MQPRENNWNVPNALTALRMLLIPVFVWVFLSGNMPVALCVFLAAGLTDILDGYIARKYNLITRLGKIMDPLADKLMIITALICLFSKGWVSPWVLGLMIVKEVFMILVADLLLKRGLVIQANWYGKVATALFTLAITLTFLHESVAPFDLILQWVAISMSLYAVYRYAIQASNLVKEQQSTRK